MKININPLWKFNTEITLVNIFVPSSKQYLNSAFVLYTYPQGEKVEYVQMQ